ncbi:hypothetical protein AB685_14445 [Bacillus sp. LL01]|uniref:hypothetical protein n=1 Tax=Bacillus sp. LL01 TaxID=1665556 RepID=UPI00064D1298|nr:hypothetical protein [Bacillus sp. LL01]KMJ58017.1 hypothetical protein AB685_14445 [Bacillus sp. LL01]
MEPNKIYLFTFHCSRKEKWTIDCINERMTKLYNIKKVHNHSFLIKTTEDINILEKYLMACFDRSDTYFLVDISDQKSKFQHIEDGNISGWIENI